MGCCAVHMRISYSDALHSVSVVLKRLLLRNNTSKLEKLSICLSPMVDIILPPGVQSGHSHFGANQSLRSSHERAMDFFVMMRSYNTR
jgi:hypothetical protein